MASTYYDSELTAAQIEAALEAISDVVKQANNGKVLGIENVTLVAKNTTRYTANLGSKSISSNGTFNASSDNLDGYDTVNVNVPNSYVAADEGKVVSNGALVAQTSRNISVDGTYDTTLNNQIVVETGGGATLIAKSITQNGTFDAQDDNADGYSSVTVNVPASGVPIVSSVPASSTGQDGDLAVVEGTGLKVLTHTPTQNASNNIVSGVLLTPSVNVNVVGVMCYVRSGATSWSAKIKRMDTGTIIWEGSNILAKYSEAWNTEYIAPLALEAGVQYKVWTWPNSGAFKYITNVDPLNPLTSIALDGFLSSSTRGAEPTASDAGRLSVSILTDEQGGDAYLGGLYQKVSGAWVRV